jgi:hypothetical protein
MQALRLSLGIIGRMAGWSLAVDMGLGLLYYPLAELILQVLYILYRLLKGGANNDSLTSVAMTTDPGTLILALFLFGSLGMLGGALLGFVGGVTAGIVIAIVSLLAARRLLDSNRYQSVLSVSSAVIGTLPTLVVLSIINIPSILSYLGDAWITIGWVMFTVIPVCIVFGAAWWASNRVIIWLENQPGKLSPS